MHYISCVRREADEKSFPSTGKIHVCSPDTYIRLPIKKGRSIKRPFFDGASCAENANKEE